ncbi:MAG: hypothetical protein IIB13_07015, partial [Chloroflexi bacterium]|nr:hypothetical protein [Chloroflexota bacterium]
MKAKSTGSLSENPVEVMNISNSRVIPEKKKRRGLLLFQIFIVIGFLTAVWFSFG